MTRRTKRDINITNYETCMDQIHAFDRAGWGGLKEPELAALTGLAEDAVFDAMRMALKLGYLERNTAGELVAAEVVS